MKKGIFVLAAAFFVPWMSRAQEAPRLFSLREAVVFAVEHNKQLQSSTMNIELFRQKVREAIAQGLPQVNGTVDYATNFNHEMSFGSSMQIKMKDQSNAKLTLQQLLFSGQWIAGIQASKIAKQLASQQVELTTQEVVENVCNSYYNILVTRRMLEIVDQNLTFMNQTFEHTRDMFAAGVVEETDVDQISITVGQLKNARLSMQRTLDLAVNLLRLQMGLEDGAPLALGDDLAGLLAPSTRGLSAADAFDPENNLQFRLVSTQTSINRKLLQVEKWSYAPTLAGQYSYTYKLLKPELDMSPNHTAGVSLSIPIFSGLQRQSKVSQARITLEQSLLDKSLLEDQLRLQDGQLRSELSNAVENHALQRENIEVARRVLASYKRKYELGALSSMELTQANSTYLQAENNYTSAALTLLQAWLQLEKLYNRLSVLYQ
ncbi:MAG: TolC family protein [Odoribacteraceae bacterium]|jgi:outer membrane protein TolC|nr:TolC family protein [Odoribacteraceae bacterium]